jgi:hypothetical protein
LGEDENDDGDVFVKGGCEDGAEIFVIPIF